jgi:hypothetical protein
MLHESTILAPAIVGLQMSPKEQNGNFLENGVNDFYQMSVICGDFILK